MIWNVYHYNINSNKIETYNLFKNGTFMSYIRKANKKYNNKEEFAKQLKRELQYYFWSRSEYEVIIEITEDNRIILYPWVGCKAPEKCRMDVTNDTGFDWGGFTKKHINLQGYKIKAKIDVYDQVMYDWEKFLDYVWENRKQLGSSYDL